MFLDTCKFKISSAYILQIFFLFLIIFRETQQYSYNVRIGTIFIDQLPTVHIFKRVHTMLASKSLAVYHKISEGL